MFTFICNVLFEQLTLSRKYHLSIEALVYVMVSANRKQDCI